MVRIFMKIYSISSIGWRCRSSFSHFQGWNSVLRIPFQPSTAGSSLLSLPFDVKQQGKTHWQLPFCHDFMLPKKRIIFQGSGSRPVELGWGDGWWWKKVNAVEANKRNAVYIQIAFFSHSSAVETDNITVSVHSSLSFSSAFSVNGMANRLYPNNENVYYLLSLISLYIFPSAYLNVVYSLEGRELGHTVVDECSPYTKHDPTDEVY